MKLKLRFKEIREKYDLTQRQLAMKLNISKSYYNYFETGERIIPLVRLNEYCNLFHLTFDYVLGFTDKLTKPRKDYVLDTELISRRIKEIRKSKKLTQKQLAELLNTSQSTISSYESGKTVILTAFLYEMCTKLNISADYVVGRSNVIKMASK